MVDRDTELSLLRIENEQNISDLLGLMDSVYRVNDHDGTYYEALLKYVDTESLTEHSSLADAIVIDNHEATYNNIVAVIHNCLKILGL